MNDNAKITSHTLTTISDVINLLATLTPQRAETFLVELGEALALGAHIKSQYDSICAELGEDQPNISPITNIVWSQEEVAAHG